MRALGVSTELRVSAEPGKAERGQSKKVAGYKPGKERTDALGHPSGTSDSTTRRNKGALSEPPSLWSFAVAAEHTKTVILSVS